MNVVIPDSLRKFIEEQVTSGHYANSDAFIADLVEAESKVFERAAQGEPIPLDEHFERRLSVLLDEAERSGDCVEVTPAEFDAMEREALEIARKRRSP